MVLKTVVTSLILLFFLLSAGLVSATTYIVPVQQPNIQAAIDITVSGDSILVDEGTYSGDGFRDVDFQGKSIVLQSISGPEFTTLDLQADSANPHRAFLIEYSDDGQPIIDGFTIVNGFAPIDTATNQALGGAIFCDSASSPILRNCVFTNNTASGGGAIYSYFANLLFEDCGICFNNPCTRIFYLTVEDSMPDTGKYYPHYWAEMSYGNQSVVGDLVSPGYVQNGVYDLIPVRLTVHYYNLLPNVYSLTVYRTDVYADAQLRQNYQSHFTVGVPVQIGLWCSTCIEDCCTSDSLPPEGWYYSQIEGGVDCLGIGAVMKSRFGSLCGEPFGSSNEVAHSLAHISMVRYYGSGTGTTWIEMGYMKQRKHVSQGGGIERTIYGEVVDSNGTNYVYLVVSAQDIDAHCPEGSNCLYEIVLDTATGKPRFGVNGGPFYETDIYFPEWKGIVGERAVYGGEIRGYESDMPGSVSDPCIIHQCKWYDGNSWIPTAFNQWTGDTLVSDTTEWGLQINSYQSIIVWDKRTL